eukprot:TRINITY_DN67927_c3_g1_i1.p1 TRINITY_DN67927_c3_g1~~TRINITY_DN67927_c3_g1_i1.p1  ORF type:complete len:622 (-),score=108.25 TRINITY_DN67927_c3_g1_i1:71-1666(-)
MSDLFELKFHRNNDNEIMCPVTYKVFNDFSHIVVVRPTGNVYSYEAVNEMNIKIKSYRDLIDGTKFTRKDIITLQDPHNLTKQNLREYHHVKNELYLPKAGTGPTNEFDRRTSHIATSNKSTARIFAELKQKEEAKEKKEQESLSNLLGAYGADDEPEGEESGPQPNNEGTEEQPQPTTTPVQISEEQIQRDAKEKKEKTKKPKKEKKPTQAPQPQVVEKKILYSNLGSHGHQFAAASLTSTALAPLRTNRKVEMTPEDIEEAMWERMKYSTEKAYVRVTTTLGDLNLELWPWAAPKTCYNFITHCNNSYYDQTFFHRSIKNFMIQGGDPLGDGTGGESVWGKEFKDEINKKCSFEGKGILAMANHGPDTNGSQFFITYKSAKYLDGKHTIFGKLVGGLETLAKMEKTKTNDKDRPIEDIKLIKASVYVNPYTECRQAVMDEANKDEIEAAKKKKEEADAIEFNKKAKWFSDPTAGFSTPKAVGTGIGKYIQPDSKKDKKRKKSETEEEEAAAEPPKKAAAAKQKWSFDGW